MKARRRTTRFGLAGGHHMSRRRIIHKNAGRKSSQDSQHRFRYSCTISLSGIKLTIKKLNNICLSKQSSQLYQLYRHAETGRMRKRPVKQLFDDFQKSNEYRFVNLGMLEKHVTEVSIHSAICDKARDLSLQGISPIKLAAEVSTFGLASVLSISCKGCGKDLLFDTSPRLETQSSKHFDINVRAVWGSLVTGNGHAHLNKFMATCNAPGFGHNSFQAIEKNINVWWRDLLQRDLESAIEEKKRIAISKGSFYQVLQDTKTAAKQLAHDIRNSLYHIYGEHCNCSKDLCKAKQQTLEDMDYIDDDNEPDILMEQSNFWSEGSSIKDQERSRGQSGLTSGDLSKCSKMKADVMAILDRVAAKRMNLGMQWPVVAWKECTGTFLGICLRGSIRNGKTPASHVENQRPNLRVPSKDGGGGLLHESTRPGRQGRHMDQRPLTVFLT